ncbi:MAG: hypothetical protein UGF45_09425, partial [Massilioclostridium sp.]|nr:hypothetical protein [Massilioclostridium sp.]
MGSGSGCGSGWEELLDGDELEDEDEEGSLLSGLLDSEGVEEGSTGLLLSGSEEDSGTELLIGSVLLVSTSGSGAEYSLVLDVSLEELLCGVLLWED